VLDPGLQAGDAPEAAAIAEQARVVGRSRVSFETLGGERVQAGMEGPEVVEPRHYLGVQRLLSAIHRQAEAVNLGLGIEACAGHEQRRPASDRHLPWERRVEIYLQARHRSH